MFDIICCLMFFGSFGVVVIGVLFVCGGNDFFFIFVFLLLGKNFFVVGVVGLILVWIDFNCEFVLCKVVEQFKFDIGVIVKLVVKDFVKIFDDFIIQVFIGKGFDVVIVVYDVIGCMV